MENMEYPTFKVNYNIIIFLNKPINIAFGIVPIGVAIPLLKLNMQ